eukprot:TRINITY_DN427_c0_g1_i1.p1 TRINITY_DN427_c0_g1~~TRINITY_DN427_c0_g1_i1.p1  ORF type:complete len:830 (-),score=218.98 TRINITY_DN427_c0_g1_i1:104-2593(-)
MADKEEQRLLRAVTRGGAAPGFKGPAVGGNDKCSVCGKTVYQQEKVIGMTGMVCHNTCFKCQQCNRTLTQGNQFLWEGKFYCQVDGKKLAQQFQSKATGAPVEVVRATEREDPATLIENIRRRNTESGEEGFTGFPRSPSSDLYKPPSRSPSVEVVSSPSIDTSSIMGNVPGPQDPPVELDLSADTNGDRDTVAALLKASYGRSTTVTARFGNSSDARSTLVTSSESPSFPPPGSTAPRKFSVSAADKCVACGKSVYQLERVVADQGKIYHKLCMRCSVCNTSVGATDFSTFEGRLYCDNHLKALKNKDAIALLEKEKADAAREEREQEQREREVRERDRDRALKEREEREKAERKQAEEEGTGGEPPSWSQNTVVREERMWAQREAKEKAASRAKLADNIASTDFDRIREEQRQRALEARANRKSRSVDAVSIQEELERREAEERRQRDLKRQQDEQAKKEASESEARRRDEAKQAEESTRAREEQEAREKLERDQAAELKQREEREHAERQEKLRQQELEAIERKKQDDLEAADRQRREEVERVERKEREEREERERQERQQVEEQQKAKEAEENKRKEAEAQAEDGRIREEAEAERIKHEKARKDAQDFANKMANEEEERLANLEGPAPATILVRGEPVVVGTSAPAPDTSAPASSQSENGATPPAILVRGEPVLVGTSGPAPSSPPPSQKENGAAPVAILVRGEPVLVGASGPAPSSPPSSLNESRDQKTEDSDSESDSDDTASSSSHASSREVLQSPSLEWIPLSPGANADTPEAKAARKAERDRKRAEKEERHKRREDRRARRTVREDRRTKRQSVSISSPVK